MIKVFYDGCIIRPSHFHTDTPRQPEPVQEYFYLHDDNIKRLNNFGEVKLRSVIGERLDEYAMLIWEEGDDLPLVQYTATFADRFGNDDTFTITKDKIQDMHENGNALKLIFDDDEEPQTHPEPPINSVENNAPTVRHNDEPKEKTSLLNAPTRQDDWFEVINLMTQQFYEKYGELPTMTQAWNALCNTPPAGYVITTNKNYLMMAGCKSLSKRNFSDRWREYTKQSQNHQT